MDVLEIKNMSYNSILENLYSSNFSVFLGNFGRGKSISLTYLSTMSALLNNRKTILSNMPIFNLSKLGVEFVPLICTSQFTENIRNTQIVLDELQKVANSRKSLSPENSFVTEFSTDVRKFNQGVTATAQFNNTYDVRLCDNTELNIVPEWKYSQKKNRSNFGIYWNMFFTDTNENETIQLNLKDIINYYDTTFKPFRLVVNHQEYIDNMYEKHKEEYVEKYIEKSNSKIKEIEDTFSNMMRGKL